jgi:membrane-associated phospholipid phosphatase
MPDSNSGSAAADALMEIDSKAHEAFAPYERNRVTRGIALLSDVGDQAQLRVISGGLLAAGLFRADTRMIAAGARMLLAHEIATALKNRVKLNVERMRPRSASDQDDEKPRLARNTDKEASSFPSGHSAGSLAVARAFAAEYPEYRTPALSAAAAIAIAQVPRCAHYPTDVAAGLLIGAVAEKLAGFLMRPARPMLCGARWQRLAVSRPTAQRCRTRLSRTSASDPK